MKSNLRKSHNGVVINRGFIRSILILLLFFSSTNCRESVTSPIKKKQKSSVDVTFQIELNEEVYQATPYGKPPQMAVWIQNQQDKDIRTLMVTYHMGICDWGGRVERPISLPYWVVFYNRQTGTSGAPTRENPAPDAITLATPKDQLLINTSVPEGSTWNYFVEVNVSGDFNDDFPKKSKDGRSDRNGNGQPSLVYKGTIEAVKGAVSQPVVLGHTDQYEVDVELTKNTKGMTTALELLESITVSCR